WIGVVEPNVDRTDTLIDQSLSARNFWRISPATWLKSCINHGATKIFAPSRFNCTLFRMISGGALTSKGGCHLGAILNNYSPYSWRRIATTWLRNRLSSKINCLPHPLIILVNHLASVLNLTTNFVLGRQP